MAKSSSVDHMSISSSVSHHRVQRSTTLNRKYVKKPAKVNIPESPAKSRTDDLKRRQALAAKINSERIAALKAGKSLRKTTSSTAKSTTPRPLASTMTKKNIKTKLSPAATKAKRAKDTAVESALKSVATMEKKVNTKSKSKVKLPKLSAKHSLGAKKLLLAFGCAALAVGVLGYIISNNTPDISVRVAAMSTGIDAKYPSYVPRGYTLSDIVSGDKSISMTFKDSEEHFFTLSEEATVWDNETLEETYVKETWGNNYTSVREQGITIFISNSDATWINGNILYKISASGYNLTKKQIKSIVTSL